VHWPFRYQPQMTKEQITSIEGTTSVHETTESWIKSRIGTEGKVMQGRPLSMVIGMGASTGRGRRVCIENGLIICTIKNRACFSTISGDGGGRRHGGDSGGRGGTWVGIGKDCVTGILGLAGRIFTGKGGPLRR
jgi:hypothetical protein